MTAPLLSIVTVVRNDLRGLKRTLRSIEAQLSALKTLPTELLIVDGASGDGSLQVAEAFRAKLGLPVRVLQQPPQGVYPAMNLGWRQARGQWLIYVNAGDLLGAVHP
ncbi:glycosyltransferase, partial [Vulcanococcus sp.]|uniref:glycosyltransferase n=1 Tax=Vulcanococcus sp. TaxID=2856995 RepID=UPI003C054390